MPFEMNDARGRNVRFARRRTKAAEAARRYRRLDEILVELRDRNLDEHAAVFTDQGEQAGLYACTLDEAVVGRGPFGSPSCGRRTCSGGRCLGSRRRLRERR